MMKVSKKYFKFIDDFTAIEDYYDEAQRNSIDSKRHDEIMSLLNGYKFHLQLHRDGRGMANNDVTDKKYEWNDIPFIAFKALLHDLRSGKLAI